MLEDRSALVTGGAQGIGAGIARCLSNAGARVAVTDLDGEKAAAVAAALPTASIGFAADASDSGAMSAAVERVREEFGRFDLLVNNAGVGGPDQDFSAAPSGDPILSMDDALWDLQLATNLRTTFASSKAAIPRLDDGGSIVNIASIAALSASPGLAAYGAAKAGVVHLTRTLAVHLAPRRIRVNAICPGLLWTRAWEVMADRLKASNPEFAALEPRQIFELVVAQSTPLGSEQTPEDIGHAVVYFASDLARNVTGQVLAIDGGISIPGAQVAAARQ